MRRLLTIITVLTLALTCNAQETDSTLFKGSFVNTELKINCLLNLYDQVIPVPGMEMDQCYGYINGSLNGMWVILKVQKMEGKKAVVRAMSERGEDAQTIEIVSTDDGLTMRQIDGANIRGVANSKYVKLPKIISFKK